MIKLPDSLNYYNTWWFDEGIHLGSKPNESAENIGILCLEVSDNVIKFRTFMDQRNIEEN